MRPHKLSLTLLLNAALALSLQGLDQQHAWAQEATQAQASSASYVEQRIAPKRGQLNVITGPSASSTLGLREGGYQLQMIKSQEAWIALNRLTLHTQLGVLDSLMFGVSLDGLFGQYSNIDEPQLSLQYTPRHEGDAQWGVRLSVKPAIWNEDTLTLSLALPARWRFSERWVLDTAPQLVFPFEQSDPSVEALARIAYTLNPKSFIGVDTKLAFSGKFSYTNLPLSAFFGYSVHHKGQRSLDLTLRAGMPGGYYFFRETPLQWNNFTVNLGVVASFGELW